MILFCYSGMHHHMLSKRQFLTIHALIVKSVSTFIWAKNYSGDSSKNGKDRKSKRSVINEGDK